MDPLTLAGLAVTALASGLGDDSAERLLPRADRLVRVIASHFPDDPQTVALATEVVSSTTGLAHEQLVLRLAHHIEADPVFADALARMLAEDAATEPESPVEGMLTGEGVRFGDGAPPTGR
jgi:hypothetical protein